MALNYNIRYPGKTAPADSEYPQGKARNVTNPNDGTGTPWDADLLNDIFGLLQSLLDAGSITPNNQPDKVGVSQYKEGIEAFIKTVITALNSADFSDLQITSLAPDLKFFETSGFDAFKINRFVKNESSFILQTRDVNNNFVSDDYQMTINENGATAHNWNLKNRIKLLLDNNGLRIIDSKLMLGVITDFLFNNLDNGKFELKKNDSTSAAILSVGNIETENIETTDLNVNGTITSQNGLVPASWVNFDGTVNPPVIKDSFNVSSVVRNSEGFYTVNFETNLATNIYCVLGSINYIQFNPTFHVGTKTTSSFQCSCYHWDNADFQTPVDMEDINIVIYARQ